MRNVSDKSRGEMKTHILCSITCFTENHAIYKIMWNIIVELNRCHITTGRMIIACLIPKATDTHSEYVILIAFPVQQWLHEYASVSHYMYVAHLVSILNSEDI